MPPQPRVTQRGYAMTLAAAAAHALTGQRMRLHWCVDLDAEGLKYEKHDPVMGLGAWADLLDRFRAGLEAQPMWDVPKPGVGEVTVAWPDRVKVAITVNMTTGFSKRRAQATFGISWETNLTTLAGRAPPLGRWIVWPEPPKELRDDGVETGRLQGDRDPTGMEWYDGIPF